MRCKSSLTALTAVTILLFAPLAQAEDAHASTHNHMALFLGAGEEKGHGNSHSASAIGLEFEKRYHDEWGIGAVLESVTVHGHTNTVIVVPLSYHLDENWRLLLGPGYEFTDGKNRALMRIGAGYQWHIADKWSVAPEILLDFIDGGSKTYLLGIAIGYSF